MVDVAADLSSLSFEAELTEDEKEFLYLRASSAGLTFCGCAHAAFLCRLVHSLRCTIKCPSVDRGSLASGDSDMCVGILGMGHMGKQLLLALLEKSGVKPSHIKISSQRSASAVELIETGVEVECFFDNLRLAAWADVLFLCCLPSHLHKVCADLRSHLCKRCLVYSFISGVPVTRLAQLLGHDFILKPQYDFVSCDTADVWLSCTHLTTALTDPLLTEASCPLTMTGGISVGLNWVSAVLYSLLNICTSASLGSSDCSLSLINNVLKEKCPHAVELDAHSFISASHASCLHTDDPFLWIYLIDAQTEETPLLCFLSSSKHMQHISAAYKSLLCKPSDSYSLM
ncbi:LOW QUALITY PROTEIN: NADP-dependent oxidoreductase domain-containing protein 1 [Lycodopsis pacificus]